MRKCYSCINSPLSNSHFSPADYFPVSTKLSMEPTLSQLQFFSSLNKRLSDESSDSCETYFLFQRMSVDLVTKG